MIRLSHSEHEEWGPPKQRMKRHHNTSKGAMTEATGQTNGAKRSNTFGSGGSAFQVGFGHSHTSATSSLTLGKLHSLTCVTLLMQCFASFRECHMSTCD